MEREKVLEVVVYSRRKFILFLSVMYEYYGRENFIIWEGWKVSCVIRRE